MTISLFFSIYKEFKFFHSIFDVGRSMFDVHLLIGSMFIFSRSMTRGVFAFKYEAEKKLGGIKGLGVRDHKAKA
jgi:hypothetical protein